MNYKKNLVNIRETLVEMSKDKTDEEMDISYFDYAYMCSEVGAITYGFILDEILAMKKKPKRVVDVGSWLNQNSQLFTQHGIEYVGIDILDGVSDIKPLENDMVTFINDDYNNVKEQFKDDLIISSLCVGYFVDFDDVMAKSYIIYHDSCLKVKDEFGNVTITKIKEEDVNE